MDLPLEFLESMKEVLGNEYDEFVKSYDKLPHSGLRVNTGKISVEDFIKIAPYKIEKIPFIDDAFFVDSNDGWSKHPYYFAGLYYLQDPSAMLPANRIPIENGDLVLDVCAAPGGKATKICNQNIGALLANDISYKRTIPLVKNLEMAGAVDFLVASEDASNLVNCYKETFDKIIVDAPCSGEGMFRKDPDLIKAWSDKRPSDYVDIQKNILDASYEMLKPGGMLMYSTCTFSKLEDEENVIDFLASHNDMKLETIKDYEGFSYGYKEYNTYCPDINKCVHVFPHKMDGEGHFMALFSKAKDYDCGNNINNISQKNSKTIIFDKLSDCVKDFLKQYSDEQMDEFKKSKYAIMENGMIFLISPMSENLMMKKIRFVRTGLHIGSIGKNNKFIPSTSLALAYKCDTFNNVLRLSSGDSNVIKYLKGETLVLDYETDIKKGFTLVAVDGYSLGFAKYDGSKFKNYYEKGWVLN